MYQNTDTRIFSSTLGVNSGSVSFVMENMLGISSSSELTEFTSVSLHGSEFRSISATDDGT